MYNSGGLRRYQEADCNSMSPEKMIVLLYEAIITHENRAAKAALSGDKLEMNRAINKAQRIITELRGALDHTIGGDIAANLDSLYSYMFRENLEAIVDCGPAHFDNVLSAIAPLLEAWRQIPPGTAEKARQEMALRTPDHEPAENGPNLADSQTSNQTGSQTPSGLETEQATETVPSQPVAAPGNDVRQTCSLSLSA